MQCKDDFDLVFWIKKSRIELTCQESKIKAPRLLCFESICNLRVQYEPKEVLLPSPLVGILLGGTLRWGSPIFLERLAGGSHPSSSIGGMKRFGAPQSGFFLEILPVSAIVYMFMSYLPAYLLQYPCTSVDCHVILPPEKVAFIIPPMSILLPPTMYFIRKA